VTAVVAVADITPVTARSAVERATTPVEAKRIVDVATAAQECARLAGQSLEMQNEWAEVRLRAQRKGGELVAEMPKNPGGRGKTSDTLSGVCSHHESSRWQRIASIPEPEFDAYIAEAHNASKELTSAGALKLAKRLAAADHVERPRLHSVDADCGPDCLHSAIVVDPPWRYDNVATRGAAEDHYPTMSLDELATLSVPAAADSHLYLWVTNGFMRQGFDLLDAWGFTYKTVLTWCKPSIGMGNYFRNNTEHVLFAVRGRQPTLRNDVGTWFEAGKTKHSAKPDSFYDLVESCSPGPYLEMFARRRRFDWHVWGNEA